MTKARSKSQIDKAIAHTGLELCYTRGDGYFYFLNKKTGYAVENSSVYVCYMNHLTVEQWVEEAEAVLKRLQEEACDEAEMQADYALRRDADGGL